ncbi:MAG: nucleotidyltransferase family protein [Vulcanimicrobiota bacterium]
MDGLSTHNEFFAVRLLELARYIAPRGNRVKFVETCEEERIRSFLEGFPEVWQRITDNPPREGIRPSLEFVAERSAYALQAAAFQELIVSRLEAAGIRCLWLNGLSLSLLLHRDIAARDFEGLQLLVSPGELAKVRSVLADLDFEESDGKLSPGQELACERWGYRRRFRHNTSGFEVVLQWRLFSHWIGSELQPFEELWSRSQILQWEGLSRWSTLGMADTLLYVGLSAFEHGWGRLQIMLDLVLALERLEFTYDEALELAGPRRVVLERAVELVVWLMGVPHPQQMTYHYGDYDRALDEWADLLSEKRPLQEELVAPELWSCNPSQALALRLSALLTPELRDIRAVALPPSLIFLYPAIRALRFILPGSS